jgi:hypothetical protein
MSAGAQHKKAQLPPAEGSHPAIKGADTSKHAAAAVVIKPYKEVITPDMKTSSGFLTVHAKEDKYYFEIPNSIMNKDILIVNRVSKASADMRNGAYGYAGDQIGEAVYRFERGPSRKLFLRRISFSEYASDSTRSLFAAVQKNNVQAIAMAFPIMAYSPDSTGVVVDATELLNSDNDILYFEKKAFKDRAGMGAQQNDRSYVDYIHTFPSNIEVHAVKTYSAGLNPTSSNYSVELNSSLVLLPAAPMQPRLQDSRVGYFTTQYRDFETDPQGVKQTVYVKRWRLEPKPEDMEKYKRGELVEPVKPIVFYIDPVTPKKWVPYLMQGINDWQKAFEKAGFKNAIIAKEAPSKAEDSTWSIDDASHSAIIYRPSVIANAMGPSVADPRSGEIIESHIFWYHNVMSLLHEWYLVQCGAVDPRARKPELDDDLMGTLIRFVSSHEVGHALGLLHNFGSSSTVPVEKLRDKAWVEANGHTPSIMDYARFNYVAQPEDNISEKGLFPRIGDYDKWAIQWGYTLHPEYNSPKEEKKALVTIVSDSLRKNHRLWFGSETEVVDGRCQSEDLGDDPVKAGAYGIKNLKRILPQLVKWVTVPDEDYDNLLEYYKAVYSQYSRYIGHALNYIGCIYRTEKVASEAGPVFELAPYSVHKNALRFINDQLFTTPLWLNNEEIMSKVSFSHRIPVEFGIELNDLQTDAINTILTRNRLSRLWWAEQSSKQKVYTVSDLLDDLNKGIFKEIYEGKNVDSYRRNMQKIYVGRLLEQTFTPDNLSQIVAPMAYHISQTDLTSLLRDNLRQLQRLCKKTLLRPTVDHLTRLHLQELDERITSKFAADIKGQ